MEASDIDLETAVGKHNVVLYCHFDEEHVVQKVRKFQRYARSTTPQKQVSYGQPM